MYFKQFYLGCLSHGASYRTRGGGYNDRLTVFGPSYLQQAEICRDTIQTE